MRDLIQRVGKKRIWYLCGALTALAVCLMLAYCSCSWEKYDPSAHDLMKEDNSAAGQTYVLQVSPMAEFPVSGGVGAMRITSFRIGKDSTKTPVPWLMEFSNDGGQNWTDKVPSWVIVENYSSSGSIQPTMVDITMRKQPEKGDSVTNYDLSTCGGTRKMNTANCYLIHMPGTYRIPLVYGNAIKNGNDNKIAYRPNGQNSAVFLTPFLNHLGKGIKSPWLKENGIQPTTAKLLWQDTKGAVTKTAIDGDYLTFTVADSAMTGNAVVAAMRNDTVCWSWHLWMTDETLEKTITVGSLQGTYTLATVNLGWVTDQKRLCQGGYRRSIMVRIRQKEGAGKQKELVLKQAGRQETTHGGYGYCTYYQWGRKDPEIPSAADGKQPRSAYDSKGKEVSNFYAAAINIEATILYPTVHFADTEEGRPGPMGHGQYNLWNAILTPAGNERGKTVKTVYDPCPPGYCLPTDDFYSFITENGEHEWDADRKGQQWTMGKTQMFLPATGLRENKVGSIWYFGTKGDYWSSFTGNQRQAPFMTFSSDGAFLKGSSSKSSAYTIRPMVEE